MEEFILFLLTFLFVLFIYRVFVILPRNKKKKKNKKYKEPIEVTYLVYKYKLDLKKVNYKQLMWIISIVSSFDIALVVSLIMLLKIFILKIILGFISIMVIIIGSYHLVYLYYKKKGMINNG